MGIHSEIQDVQITQAGTTQLINSATAFSTAPIPLNSNGDSPRVVRVVSSHIVHLKFGPVGMTTCTQSDMLVPAGYEVFYNTRGQKNYSAVINTIFAANNSVALNIMPVEI